MFQRNTTEQKMMTIEGKHHFHATTIRTKVHTHLFVSSTDFPAGHNDFSFTLRKQPLRLVFAELDLSEKGAKRVQIQIDENCRFA